MGMEKGAKEQERAGLHRMIWSVAHDLRGCVGGWDFENYVLGILFYRYISENLAYHVNKMEHDRGNTRFDYAMLGNNAAEQFRESVTEDRGFFILPDELFCNLCSRAAHDRRLSSTLENIFQNIEASSQGYKSERNFCGLFAEVDVNSVKLGDTPEKRNERLVKLLEGVAKMNLGNYQENTVDVFGDAYEFLIGMYASNAGKSGGEYFTPQEVSELLTRIAVAGKTEVRNVYEIKTRYLIQNTAA
jgi:type I restriction enzyme M protein